MPKALHKPPTMRGGKEPQKSRTKLRTIYIASPPAYSVWSGPLVANRHTHTKRQRGSQRTKTKTEAEAVAEAEAETEPAACCTFAPNAICSLGIWVKLQ